MTAAVKELLTRPVPRRAICCNGHALQVLAERPSWWHDDPRRPCLVPTLPTASPPRRSL